MQLTGDPAALFLLRAHQAAGQRLDLLLRAFPFRDVDERSGVPEERAVRGEPRHAIADHPAVLAVEAAHPELVAVRAMFRRRLVEALRARARSSG